MTDNRNNKSKEKQHGIEIEFTDSENGNINSVSAVNMRHKERQGQRRPKDTETHNRDKEEMDKDSESENENERKEEQKIENDDSISVFEEQRNVQKNTKSNEYMALEIKVLSGDEREKFERQKRGKTPPRLRKAMLKREPYPKFRHKSNSIIFLGYLLWRVILCFVCCFWCVFGCVFSLHVVNEFKKNKK